MSKVMRIAVLILGRILNVIVNVVLALLVSLLPVTTAGMA